MRRENAKLYLTSLRGALATKQTILSLRGAMDFFAALAMTWMGRGVPDHPPSLAMTIPNQLNRFTRIRHRGRKTAVDRDRLAVDIGSVVAGEEQSHRGEFVRLPGAFQGVELADLVGGAALLGAIEYRPGHAGFDQPRADRIDAHAGPGQRIGGGPHQADHAGLARAVGMSAGAGLEPCDRGGADDRARLLLDHVRDRMLDREERSDQIDAQHF